MFASVEPVIIYRDLKNCIQDFVFFFFFLNNKTSPNLCLKMYIFSHQVSTVFAGKEVCIINGPPGHPKAELEKNVVQVWRLPTEDRNLPNDSHKRLSSNTTKMS